MQLAPFGLPACQYKFPEPFILHIMRELHEKFYLMHALLHEPGNNGIYNSHMFERAYKVIIKRSIGGISLTVCHLFL
jgi:hypothetical protein